MPSRWRRRPLTHCATCRVLRPPAAPGSAGSLPRGVATHDATASSKCLTCADRGRGSTAPYPVVANAAAALAQRAADTGSAPAAMRARYAPSKQSPAPVASMARTLWAATATRSCPSDTSEPRGPNFSTTVFAPMRWHQATISLGSVRPQTNCTSSRLGRKWSHSGIVVAMTSAHAPAATAAAAGWGRKSSLHPPRVPRPWPAAPSRWPID